MDITCSYVQNPAYDVRSEELAKAIIELNSMSPCDGVFMMRDGRIGVAYRDDAQILCELIPAPLLARQLTADGLSSYTGKELRAWAEAYEKEPLQAKVDAALQEWLTSAQTVADVLLFVQSYPHVIQASVADDGSLQVEMAEGEEVPTGLQHLLEFCRK